MKHNYIILFTFIFFSTVLISFTFFYKIYYKKYNEKLNQLENSKKNDFKQQKSQYCFSDFYYKQEISPNITLNEMLLKEYFSNCTEETIHDKHVNQIYENERFNLENFNYKDNCNFPFKYKPSNKRDLLFNSIFYRTKKQWKKHKSQIQQAIGLSNKTIGNATKILYLYGKVKDEEFEQMFTENGYKIIDSEMKFSTKDKKFIVSQRYLDFEKYLREHQNEYDRVVFTDTRDVYWFADGFATISPDELILMLECDDLGNFTMKCLSFGDMNKKEANYKWMTKFYGFDIYNDLYNRNVPIVNGGFIAGSVEKTLKFLEVMNEQLNQKPEFLFKWGYDQATLNHVYHTGKLDFLNITMNTITQRLGFDLKKKYRYDSESKGVYMNSNGCSPIIRHKMSKNC